MRWLPDRCGGRLGALFALLVLFASSDTVSVQAAPKPGAQTTPAPVTFPDYGGRDSAGSPAPTAGGPATLNPLAQAWRAFESLVIVLAGVIGVLYALKRYGLVKGESSLPSAPAASPWWTFLLKRTSSLTRPAIPQPSTPASLLTIRQSQTLPGAGGATVHLVTVADRTLLLGATGQNVTLLTEWEEETPPRVAETQAEKERFDAYLSREGVMPEPSADQVVQSRVAESADRLQSLLAKCRAELSSAAAPGQDKP